MGVSRVVGRVRSVLVVAALVAGVLVGVAVGSKPAAAAEVAGMTFYHCTDFPNASTTYYVLVGSSPIKTNVADFGYTTSNVATDATVTSRTCASLPDHPVNGTLVRAYASGVAKSYYEIVGGAPIPTTRTTAAKIGQSALAAASLLSPQPSDPSHPCGTALAGCLTSAPVAGTKFKGTGGAQYYGVDASEHINPLAEAAPASAAVVDQSQINACTRMNCNVFGQVQSIDSPGYGLLHVAGFALDSVTPASLNVHLTVGTLAFDFPANQTQQGTLLGRIGSNSYDRTFAVPAGHYEVCITYNGGMAPGTTAEMGCSGADVLGAGPGRVHTVKAKALGHHKVKVKWKAANANGSPITLYFIKCKGMKVKVVSGAEHHAVIKHVPGGRRQFEVRAQNSLARGRWSKKSKPVTVR